VSERGMPRGVDAAVHAEALGYDGIGITEHH
jgi:alkanesulfonate monooxygenase SsuD/methylene tetrahydromethanopterin reductase-like flavin-dependent oxidoreductase (luciferase family)